MNMSRAVRAQLIGCDLLVGLIDSAEAMDAPGVPPILKRLGKHAEQAASSACQRMDGSGKWILDDKATRQYVAALDAVKASLYGQHGETIPAIEFIKQVQLWVEDLRATLPPHPVERRIPWSAASCGRTSPTTCNCSTSSLTPNGQRTTSSTQAWQRANNSNAIQASGRPGRVMQETNQGKRLAANYNLACLEARREAGFYEGFPTWRVQFSHECPACAAAKIARLERKIAAYRRAAKLAKSCLEVAHA